MKNNLILLLAICSIGVMSCKKEDKTTPTNPNQTITKWTVTQNSLKLNGEPYSLGSQDVELYNNFSGRFLAGKDQYNNTSMRKAKFNLYSPTNNQYFQKGLQIGQLDFVSTKTWELELYPVDTNGGILPIQLASYVNISNLGNITISDMIENKTNGYGAEMIEFEFNNLMVSDRLMHQGTGTQGTNTQGTPTLGVFQGLLRLELK